MTIFSVQIQGYIARLFSIEINRKYDIIILRVSFCSDIWYCNILPYYLGNILAYYLDKLDTQYNNDINVVQVTRPHYSYKYNLLISDNFDSHQHSDNKCVHSSVILIYNRNIFASSWLIDDKHILIWVISENRKIFISKRLKLSFNFTIIRFNFTTWKNS